MKVDKETHHLFTRKREAFFPFQFIFLGYLLVLFGFYLLITVNFWGVLAIAAGTFISFSTTGIQLNFEENLYREYFGIFQVKFGKWLKLKKIDYVTVFINKAVQEMHVASISSTQSNKDIAINLIISKTSRISIGIFKNKTLAMETAQLLSDNLNCRLLDYTSGKPVWVKQ